MFIRSIGFPIFVVLMETAVMSWTGKFIGSKEDVLSLRLLMYIADLGRSFIVLLVVDDSMRVHAWCVNDDFV